MKNSQVSKSQSRRLANLVLVLAVIVLLSVSASSLVKHVLSGTYYDTSSPGANASCGTPNCVATANIYTEQIPCPGAAGVKCTYEVSITALTSLPSSVDGLYQFLIDGAVPTGGGTDSNGFYTWGVSNPPGMTVTSTYTVTSQVTNTSSNQTHAIVVNLGCSMGSSGCSAQSGLAILTVRVLKP